MAVWQTLRVSDLITGQAQIDGIQDTLDTIMGTVSLATAIIDLLQAVLASLPDNPAQAVIAVLLAEVQTILDNLRESGISGLIVLPTTLDELARYQGGFRGFEKKCVDAFFDVEDPNRPQVAASGTAGALVLAIDTSVAADFLDQVQSLLTLFRMADPDVRYPAPVNVTITPATEDGVPQGTTLSLWDVGNDLTTLLLEWEEPKFTQSVFYDIFRDQKFYIERSRSREGVLVTREKTAQTLNPLQKRAGVTVEEVVVTRRGQPMYAWEPLNPADPFVLPTHPDVGYNYIVGQYSYLIRGLEKGVENGYYYRIKSVPIDVDIFELDGITTLLRDGVEWDESVASSPVLGYLPRVDTAFNMPQALLNAYRAAYLLRFDTWLPDMETPLVGSNTVLPPLPAFVTEGMGEYAGIDVADTPVYPTITGVGEARRAVALQSLVSSQALEEDPFSGAREVFSDKFGANPAERLAGYIDKLALAKVDRILDIILQNEGLAEMVKTLYLDAGVAVINVLTGVPTQVVTNVGYREKIALVVNAVDGYDKVGLPPNWRSIRLLRDVIPEADSVVDTLSKMLTGLEGAYKGPAQGLSDTLEALQNRFAIITALIDTLDSIIAFYNSLRALDRVGMLWIPAQPGGVPYVVREILAATAKPVVRENAYTGGVVLFFGGAGPADYEGAENALKWVFGV